METVQIIHPETGGIAEVPDSSLPHHYRAGWRLLADDEAPPPGPASEPPPMTRAQAAKAAKETASAESEE